MKMLDLLRVRRLVTQTDLRPILGVPLMARQQTKESLTICALLDIRHRRPNEEKNFGRI